MEYIEVPEVNPGQDGLCSDNDCPCGFPGAKIPRGSGHIYVSKEVVDFRRDALSVRAAERKIAALKQNMGGGMVMFAPNTFAPILMCEQGARKRGLDLEVAAADARHWWKTGLVPLRATPLAVSAAPKPKKSTASEKPVVAKPKAEDKKVVTALPPKKGTSAEKIIKPEKKTSRKAADMPTADMKAEVSKDIPEPVKTKNTLAAVSMYMPEKADLKQNLWLALANVNLFGLGYWLSNHVKRGLIAVGVGLLLAIIAHVSNASKNPKLWAWLFLLYFLGMAVDLWLLLKKNKQELTLPSWLPRSSAILPALAVLVNVLFYGGFLAYRAAGNDLYQKGMAAYQQPDQQTAAFGNLYAFSTYYRLSLNPLIPQVEKPLGEVAMLIDTRNQVDAGEFESALASLAKFKTLFPASKGKAHMDLAGFEAYLGLAQKQDKENHFDEGHQSLRLAFNRFPATAKGHEQQLMDAYSAHYLAWGTYLNSQKEYATAIEKLEYLITYYPKADEYKPAYEAAAQAYVDWSAQLSADKKDEDAALKLEQVLAVYDKSAAYTKAKQALPLAYLNWSKVLQSQKHYLLAMDKMQAIKTLTSSAEYIKQADEEYQKLVALLARDTGEDGKQVLAEAKAQACKGVIPTHPAVGFLTEEPGRVLACATSASWLSADKVARMPGELKFVFTENLNFRTVQSCPYTNGRTLERVQSYIEVELLEVSTGKLIAKKTIYGSSPPSCPMFHYFTGMTDSMGGDFPDDAKIDEWLGQVLQ